MSQKSALARLLRDNRAYWPGLIWLVVLMLLSGVFKSYAAEYLGQAIDRFSRCQTIVSPA